MELFLLLLLTTKKEMNLSYWEKSEWFTNVDFAIIGSGIVGLNAALTIKEKYPEAKVLVLERGLLPQGASTKNAGFTCFGSISEILSDLKNHSEDEVLQLLEKRWKGLALLRKNLGDKVIDYQEHGSFELFSETDNLFQNCMDNQAKINSLLAPIFKTAVFHKTENTFGFKQVRNHYIWNKFEGQINTGKMMAALLQLAQSKGVKIVNNTTVKSCDSDANKVSIALENDFTFSAKKVLIATNGFAKKLLKEDIQPARAQVLITKPIQELHIQGTFHLDEGYYYFRNIDNRILFGGGRNIDFKGEETTKMETSNLIQATLEELLKTTILPNTPFEIEQRWTGIMGVGKQKKAIVKQLDTHIFCGIRLGGMGVAIGSLVGKELGELVL